MPKLKEPTATKKEVDSLNKKVYRFLSDKKISMFGLSLKIGINENTLYNKVNGRNAMRMTEHKRILKVISK